MKNFFYFLSIASLLISHSIAQQNAEQKSQATAVTTGKVKSLIIDANKIKTILYNTGSISNPGVINNVLDFTWNGLGYAYEIGLLVGAKVQRNNSTDSVEIVSEGFGASNKNTADGDFAPDAVTKWGFLPTSNFGDTSSNNIANNQDPTTWDHSWAKWPGKYGDAIADMELVYEMDDFSNAEFDYYPFPADTLKRGLGITVNSRVYQFSHPNLEDVLFNSFEITNSSPKKLEHVVAGIFGDPHIGGANNYSDDAVDFNKETQIFYSWDPDNKSDIPAITPGYFGWTFYDTPLQKGITSFSLMFFGGPNRPKNDPLMYNALREGNLDTTFLYSTSSSNIGDYVNIMGTGFFPLDSSQTVKTTIVYLFGYDFEELLSKSILAKQYYDLRFNKQGEPITITSPAADQRIQSLSTQIQWSAQTLDGDTTVDLYYSNTTNEQWHVIAKNAPNTGSYEWNLSSLPDGAFYKVHLLQKKGETASYDSTGGYFTIDRAGNASPEISILSPKNIKVVSNTLPIQWIARDAEDDPISIKIYFSENDGSSYQLVKEVVNTGEYSFDTKQFANTYGGRIKLEAITTGAAVSVETKSFRISNFFKAITDTSSLQHISGFATGKIFPGIADSSTLTGHKYRITFDTSNGNLVYNLKDVNTNTTLLTKEPLTGINGSGKLVDGMRIWFTNDPLGIDTARSKFVTQIENITPKAGPPTIGTARYAPIDLKIEFGSLDTNAAGDYLYPYDSAGTNNPNIKTVKVPFRVSVVDDTTKVLIVVKDKFDTWKQNRWDLGEEFTILTPSPYNISPNNTFAGVIFNKINPLSNASIPNGAVFYVRTKRPFTINDVYEFTADKKYGQPTKINPNTIIPATFALEQNYPNPFNPITHIQFSIPSAGMTSLTVYDIMGREVKQLAKEYLSAGDYTFEWNGTNNYSQKVSSGIYFYRLQSGNNADTKKMILLK